MNMRFLAKAFFALTLTHYAFGMEELEFNSLKNDIQQSLNADVVSPAVIKDTIKKLSYIDEQGTPVQQAAAATLLKENSTVLNNSIQRAITSTLTNSEVKQFLGAIAIGTFYGVLPSIGLQALSILSGNLDLTTAQTALIDTGILAALDAFVRYAAEKGGISPEMGAINAGVLSVSIQQFIGFAGARPKNIPLLGITGRPLIAGLQAMTLDLINKELNKTGGTSALLQKVNWKDIAMGPENQEAITEYPGAYEFIRNNLSMIIQNETVRSATASVVTYAVEGAIIGAVMHTLGLGFYDETLPMALTNAMMRGTLEGLYAAGRYSEQNIGITQRLTGGFTSLSVQRYMQSGVGVSTLDITPIAIQQITAGAITGIVRQAGGWANTFKSLYSTGKRAFFGGN